MIRHPISLRSLRIKQSILKDSLTHKPRTFPNKFDDKENKFKVGLNTSYEIYLRDHRILDEEGFDLKSPDLKSPDLRSPDLKSFDKSPDLRSPDLKSSFEMKSNIKPQTQQKSASTLNNILKIRRKSCQCTCCGGISLFELRTIDIPNNIIREQKIQNAVTVINNNNERSSGKYFRKVSTYMNFEKKKSNIYGLMMPASKMCI